MLAHTRLFGIVSIFVGWLLKSQDNGAFLFCIGLAQASQKESSIRDYRSTNRIRKSTTYFCLILADIKNISCLRTSLFESGNLQLLFLGHLSRPTAPEKKLNTKKIQLRTHKTSKMQVLDKACILVLGVSQRESKLTRRSNLTCPSNTISNMVIFCIPFA